MKPFFASALIQPVGNDPDHDVIRDQTPARHDVLGLEADRRAGGNGRTQHFAGGELDDPVVMNEPLRLRSLSRPRRSEKNQSHEELPPRLVSERPRTCASISRTAQITTSTEPPAK